MKKNYTFAAGLFLSSKCEKFQKYKQEARMFVEMRTCLFGCTGNFHNLDGG